MTLTDFLRMNFPNPAGRIPCCIDVPGFLYAGAAYAIEMLLFPLGLTPEWVNRDELNQGGIFYGTDGTGTSNGAIVILVRPDTLHYFRTRQAFPAPNAAQSPIRSETLQYPFLSEGQSTLPGDIVASTFFWLSGWQEYVTTPRDVHGRFAHRDSLQHAWGISCVPLVDCYRNLLAAELQKRGIVYHRRRWNERQWAACFTHDIDAFRKNRPGIVYREAVHYLVQNQQGRPGKQRFSRFLRFGRDLLTANDPFTCGCHALLDTYRRTGTSGTFFIKGGGGAAQDTSYDIRTQRFRKWTKAVLAADCEIGIHPGYFVYANGTRFLREKDNVERSAGIPVAVCRQHYLRYDLRNTPVVQANCGIRIDSSLGFADHEGFRRATSLPFRVFDLVDDRSLDVWEIPLVLMDTTLHGYRGLTVAKGEEIVRLLMRTCREMNGVFVSLWHNTIYDETDWPGWGGFFERIVQEAVREGAYVSSLEDALDRWLDD